MVAALGGVVWFATRSTEPQPSTVAAHPPAPPAPIPSPAPATPPRATAKPATSEAAAPSAPSAERTDVADAVESAPSDTEETVPVTVHVSPQHAVLFKDGRRFGTGEVTFNVARGTKTTLVARLDGYVPRTIVIDGKYNSVNIALKTSEPDPVPAARAASPEEVTAPSPKPNRNTGPAPEGDPPEGATKPENDRLGDSPSPPKNAPESEPSKPSPEPGSQVDSF